MDSVAVPSFVLNCPKCAVPFHTSGDLDRHLETEHDAGDPDDPDEDILDEDMMMDMDGTEGKKIVVSNFDCPFKNQRKTAVTRMYWARVSFGILISCLCFGP